MGVDQCGVWLSSRDSRCATTCSSDRRAGWRKCDSGWLRPDSGVAGTNSRAQSGARPIYGRNGRRRADRRVLFNFLPDGRIMAASAPDISGYRQRRQGVGIEGLPSNLWARGQGLFEVRPDRAFAQNRTIYLTYTVLPDGANQQALPRSPGVLVVARAKLSGDDKRIEDVKVLLNGEGTLGRVIQAPDGTLLVTSSIPAGLGINSVDWPQPQALDSNMGKVLRINTDGTIPKDNPFVGRPGAHPEIYALGFRDIQGITIHPRTGKLWTSEHGREAATKSTPSKKGRTTVSPL